MKEIAIVGAGGFGREVLALINQINEINKSYTILGFFDDQISVGTKINSYPVLGTVDSINSDKYIDLHLAIAIGDPFVKEKIINKIKNPTAIYPTLIHPSVIIGDKNSVTIGEGCIFCAGVIITTNIEINNFVIINLSCTVGHDTVIADYSSFMPSVNISGEVIVNKSVYVGTGAKIINMLEIGAGSTIGAGAVVARSLPANCTAVGVPAKVIKYREDNR